MSWNRNLMRGASMVALAAVASCSGCGGGGAGAGAGDSTPALQAWQSWNFAEPTGASGWQLSAAGTVDGVAPAAADTPPQALAQITQGVLTLQSAMSTSESGEVQCPVASAEMPLTLAPLAAGSVQTLVIDLSVSRWDLGLGPYDTDLPRLELVIQGQRYRMGVEGFKVMPGTARFTWSATQGLSSRYGDVPSTRTAEVTPDTGAPRLKLWIDGCSQGMSQVLKINRIALSGR